MTVKSVELKDGKPIPSRRGRVGFLRPGHVEGAFVFVLYTALLLLVALSIVGTFYGLLGASAPVSAPLRILGALSGAPKLALLAFAIQAVLTVTQYGARQMAHHDRRWWLLYLVALGISVYYNVQAYWTPLTDMVRWYLAALLIVAGDVLPEFIAVRRE